MGLPSLYRLAEQHRELEQLGTDEDLDETTLQAIRETLDGLQGNIQEKTQGIAAHTLNLEAYATAAKDASKKLAERAKRIERRAEAMRAYMLAQLETVGLLKIEGPEFTVSIRKNPASVVVAPDADLGDEWMVSPPRRRPHPTSARSPRR